MLIYKIKFSLYFCGRGLKGCARQLWAWPSNLRIVPLYTKFFLTYFIFLNYLYFLWAWPKMLFIAPEKDENEDSQLYFYLLLLLLLLAINAKGP